MDKLLKVIEENARLSAEEIAAVVGQTPEAVRARLKEYKARGVLRGSRTLINWDAVGGNGVHALIEVKVTPRKGIGFDEVAETISRLEEVDGVQLMSGGYDLSVFVSGASFREVALFVAQRLAPIEGVLSTATHFVLKTYKKDGAVFSVPETDERQTSL